MESLVIGVPRSRGIGLVLLAAGLLALAVRADPAGRLLAGPAAVAALLVGGWELASGPVLRADASGLSVRQGLRRCCVPWPSVIRMRVLRDRRTELLELDLDGRVAVLSRSRLGRLPTDVLTDLLAVRDRVTG